MHAENLRKAATREAQFNSHCCVFCFSRAAGTLSVQEFLAIPELEHNPLVNRVVHTFDIDKSGEVDFREFVSSLSVFATHEAEGKEQKYKCTARGTATATHAIITAHEIAGTQKRRAMNVLAHASQARTEWKGELRSSLFLVSSIMFPLRFLVTFRVYDVDNDGFISNADLYHVLKAMVGSNLNDVQLQQLVDRTIIQGDKDKDGKLSYEEFKEMVKDGELEQKLKIDF
jgi:Ca2+-binding EF-hand superfamily protein